MPAHTFSCSFMPSDNSNSHNWCDLMKIIISKCVGNKFEDYVKWYMKIWINFCLPASTHCTVIVCKYALCVCVCFTKIFNKHLSMSEQKFCAADVNKFSNKFSARESERKKIGQMTPKCVVGIYFQLLLMFTLRFSTNLCAVYRTSTVNI